MRTIINLEKGPVSIFNALINAEPNELNDVFAPQILIADTLRCLTGWHILEEEDELDRGEKLKY
jgi:hypothetical protein